MLAPLQLGEDRVEVRARLRHRQAAQHVVGAEFDDDEIGLAPSAPRSTQAQPRPAACAAVSPETPALRTRAATPCRRSAACSCGGEALRSACRP